MESIDSYGNELRNSNHFQDAGIIQKEKFRIVNKVGLIYSIYLSFQKQIGGIFFEIYTKFFPDFIKKYKRDSIY